VGEHVERAHGIEKKGQQEVRTRGHRLRGL